MYLIPRFIWKKLNPGIEVSSGRAACYICSRKLREICQIPNETKYYCRKHAKEILNYEEKQIKTNSQTEATSGVGKTKIRNKKTLSQKDLSFEGQCHYCKKQIAKVYAYYCKYCQHWHCSKDRIPENHKCTHKGKKISLTKEGNVTYK